MADLHITLLSAALAALLNIWLALRCGYARRNANVSIGDGGDVALVKRMRAHANYVENAPFVLVLIFALEYTGHYYWPLAAVSATFFVGRVLHALGMDADKPSPLRIAGTVITLFSLLGLSIAAVLAALGVI